MCKQKAVFFDRDGVINIPKIIKNTPYPPKKFKDLVLYRQVKNCIYNLKKYKFKTIIITNQPDYKRGLVQKNEIIKINSYIKKIFNIDKVYVCYDTSNKSFFKKPNPGMIISAKKKFNLNLKSSFIIGDTEKDILAGKRSGCKTILLKKKYNYHYKNIANYYVENLNEATKTIINTINEK